MLGRSIINWGPKLHKDSKLPSSSCLSIDMTSCCSSNTSLRFNSRYTDFDSFNSPSTLTRSTTTPRWRMLWRKFKKEKRRIFESSVPFQVPYDPYTYSQNFDQDSAWADPDNLSRSFSVRFADPSKFFGRKLVSVA